LSLVERPRIRAGTLDLVGQVGHRASAGPPFFSAAIIAVAR
jgi:hypothetical protein